MQQHTLVLLTETEQVTHLLGGMAVDLAAIHSTIIFADDTSYVLALYDIGAVAYRDRDWIRLGAGAARWDLPVGGSDRLTISSWQCLPDSFMFGH